MIPLRLLRGAWRSLTPVSDLRLQRFAVSGGEGQADDSLAEQRVGLGASQAGGHLGGKGGTQGGVEHEGPEDVRATGEDKGLRLGAVVEQEQKRAGGITHCAHQCAKAAAGLLMPFFMMQQGAIAFQPEDVAQAGGGIELAIEIAAAAKHLMAAAEGGDLPGEGEHFFVAVVPVDPADVAVLAVGVVVAALGAAAFVTSGNKRDTQGTHHGGDQAAAEPCACLQYCRVGGGAFHAAVGAVVVAVAVAIVLVVGFIVLVRVADEVQQREAIVRGEEIDAGQRRALIPAEDVLAAAETLGEFGGAA